MYVSAETVLAPRLLRHARQDLASLVAPWRPGSVTLFASCKAALWGAWRSLGMTSGDRVLSPAYIFRGVLEPGASLGVEYDYYRILPDLQPDLDDLVAKIDERTKAVLLVHFFGFPGPSSALRDICDEHHIALVEDCAHAMFGECPEGPLGSFGDASVFSFKKTMPVPGGGALVINRPDLRFSEPLSLPPAGSTALLMALRVWNSCESMMGLSVKTALLSAHDFRRRLARRKQPAQKDFRQQMSRVSQAVASHVDRGQAIARRRENHEFLRRALAGLPDIRPVFPALAPGVVPFCFPVYAAKRDDLQDYLLRKGVHARVYWDASELPPNALAQYPELAEILDTILAIPAHQDITLGQLARVAKLLRTDLPV